MSASFLWLDLQTRRRIHQLAHDCYLDQERQFLAEDFINGCVLCKGPSAANCPSAEIKGDSGTEAKLT
jgi:hypothetical protein